MGNKGFRNLPKLERLKRGRPAPAPPPRRAGTRPFSSRARRPVSVSLSSFPAPHQKLILNLAELLDPSAEAYLVGGAVRDLLLSRHPLDDLDVTLPAGALDAAQALAASTGGRCFCLDAERGAGRVVVSGAEGQIQIDLTAFKAPSLEADLRRRDLTINAMALSVRGLAERGEAPVLDPTGGLEDLAKRRLRLAAPGAFSEDPVRALRAVRLAGTLGFQPDPAVCRAARTVAARLTTAAAERVRDELAGILSLPRAAAGVRMLDRLGLLAPLLPESAAMKSAPQPAPHRFSVWEHSLRAVEAVDQLLAGLGGLAPHQDELAAHLAAPLGDGFTRREVLKLAALLHDVAKPSCRQVVDGRTRFIGHDAVGAEMAKVIAHRLRLSGAATAALERLVRQHLRPMHLARTPALSRRARYRFFRDLETEAHDLLLLALADVAAVRGLSPLAVWRGALGKLVNDLLSGWKEDRQQAAAPPLVRGEDVMAAFGLTPGPLVGRLLALAREAQDLGQVRTREEALAYLARHAQGSLDTGRVDL
jgi:poly(A) polymerase/tRNA nucleotidyltransferase (CCA-adding enzyme)